MNIERLKSLRIESGKSQKEIADYLQIDRTSYVKYESGANNPSAKRLSQLAEYFGVSIDYLMDEDSAFQSVPPDFKFDFQKFKQTSPRETAYEKDELGKKALELFAQMDEEHKKAAIAQLEALVALNKK